MGRGTLSCLATSLMCLVARGGIAEMMAWGGGIAEFEGSREGRGRGIGGIAYRLGDSGRRATPF